MKILVVDDHVLIREALRGVLKELKGDVVILEASTGGEAMRFIANNADLKLILLDLNLPDRDGYSVLDELSETHPEIPVVVLSGRQDSDSVAKALDHGAVGFIPKSGERAVMLGALQLVFAGGIYIPPEILKAKPSGAATKASDAAAKPSEAAAMPPASPAELALTERQLDVLALIMQGKSNKAICRVLNLAEPTVKNHVTAILKALNSTNRTEVVIAVNKMGWQFPPVAKS
jgi:DNA-binding NarL/FixJ family response regulator